MGLDHAFLGGVAPLGFLGVRFSERKTESDEALAEDTCWTIHRRLENEAQSPDQVVDLLEATCPFRAQFHELPYHLSRCSCFDHHSRLASFWTRGCL